MTATADAAPATDEAPTLVRVARHALADDRGDLSCDADAAADIALGLSAFGDYELLEVIGAGGMGVVYRARHRALDRDVALKVVAESGGDDPADTTFLDEARAAARLNHPNIVPVHDVGSVGGLNYIAMQLVEGEHLGRRLARGRLGEPEAIALLLPLCDALHYAHRLGVLHLDIKPANMLIDARGAPLVADFGLARRVGAVAGETAGTPAYMAPESLRAGERLSAASDVYSLGAVLFEMLAGVPPHGRGETATLVARARAGTLESLSAHRPDLSPDLAAVCLHCLQLDPARRYASAADLAEDLRRVRDGLPVSVRRPRWGERLDRWLRREPRFGAALAAALLATIVGALAWFVMWQRAESARASAELSAELGARLYVLSDPIETDVRSGTELVRWLHERLPNEPERQAAVLTDYIDALVAERAGLRMHTLVYEVNKTLGVEYRRQVVDVVRARGDAQGLLHAAMLLWNLEFDRELELGPSQQAAFPAAMRAALAAAPDSALAWMVAASYCARGDAAEPLRCAVPGAAERFVALEPENGYAWSVLAATSPEPRARDALREAARRRDFRDQYARDRAQLYEAVATSGVEVPLPLQIATRALTLGPPIEYLAALEAWGIPDAVGRRLTWMCDPASNLALDPAMREDCVALGTAMARRGSAVSTNMIGSAMVRRLVPGTPLAREMIELRRVVLYRREVNSHATPEERRVHPRGQMGSDIVEVGELGAMGRWLQRLGIAPDPPAGWESRDPDALKLPEERAPRR